MRDADNPFGKYSHLLGGLQLKPTALLRTAELMQYTKFLEYNIGNQIYDKNVKDIKDTVNYQKCSKIFKTWNYSGKELT